jgi:secreted PhoX family phosphatase
VLHSDLTRRDFLRFSAALGGAVLGSSVWRTAAACELAVGGVGPYGALQAPDANGIMLPVGFTSRVVARAGEVVPGTTHVWHMFPDGGATFRVRGGWVYVSNSESIPGGVGALRFDRDGTIVDAYTICSGTNINCAGGATPWRTWLTCEEHGSGRVWECDPTGESLAIARPALGTFKHEAVAVDTRRHQLYLTEDESNGRFYRFTPARWRNLTAGTLEVAVVDGDGFVTWVPVLDPNPVFPGGTPTRLQIPASTPFNGGEGIVYRKGHVYFTTKGDNRVWDYDVAAQALCVRYEAGLDPMQQLTGVDNITAARSGDLVVAEDGTTMELVVITPDGVVAPLLRVVGQAGSELTGPAFSRRDKRLYFSSQRAGMSGTGITYEVTGPFRRSARA